MTTVNVIEDSNNPAKYLIISSQGATSESIISTNVVVSSNNRIEVIEISKIQGDKGEKGDVGAQGPPGENGVIFDVLPINSGGTNNTAFNNNKIIYYDGTKLTSSNIDINNIQTDIISNIYGGSGLSKEQNGQSVTINAALGNGLTLDAFNRIAIDDNTIITQYNFNLSDNYINGTLNIAHGGTNNTFFSDDKFVYYDGEKLSSFPLSTGAIVVSGQSVNIVAGSGLVGGGSLTIPNGSIVIGLQNSADILVTNDSIELSTIVNSGTYSKVSVDSKGRVIHGSQITLSDLVSYLGFTPWYSGNDGAGSNLDADMLDGQHGSYYLDASNLSGTISNSILQETISPGSAPKVTFNSKGIIIDSGILSYLDITDGLGYIPFDKNGGQILGDVELFGALLADSGSFESNNIGIGSYDSSLDARGIRFRYGDYPQKDAILGYFPSSNLFRIISPTHSGTIITEEKADTKYVGITGYQEISGIKDFLETITTYGRVIIRSKYNSLPPLDVGTNNQLVLYLNSDYLDNQHGHYYRNAANLTGTLNEYVILPHLEDRSTVLYSNNGEESLEYIPKFHRPSSGHPIVLKDSLIYETGSVIYMDYASLSIGLNSISQDAYYTTVIGVNNSGTETAQNSLAVGDSNIVSGLNTVALNKNNIAMTDNSIAMGTYAETWIDNQIAVGGFSHSVIGTNGQSSRDAHGQLSYIPLKYHGEASSWINILNFDLPDNRTIEYSAELLFTKQKETGVASFSISTGIIKNYGYRDPARNYEAFKKTIPVVHHRVSELYNNSQERTYTLNINGVSEIDQEINQSTLKITAPPLQYRPLNIESYDSPILVEPISDHQTRLKTIRGNVLAGGYRPEYVIKLSPFDAYPYNSGAKINLGKSIDNLTECLYYRISGSPTGYIKFYNHGISNKCPLYFDTYIGSTGLGISGLIRRDNNFNFKIIDSTNSSVKISCTEPPISGYIFRQYIDKNIYGNITGTAVFNIYQVSGLSNQNYSPYSPGGYNSSLNSIFYETLSFNFDIQNLSSHSKDWSTLDNHKISLGIVKLNNTSWNKYSLNINGYINPILGTLDFHLSQSQPFGGPGIPTGSNPNPPYDTYYYYPSYYIDELSFVTTLNPYKFIKNITDSFRVIDDNTISFHETQLGFVSGSNLILTPYPNQIKDIINFDKSIYNTFLKLKNNDLLYINNTLVRVTGSYEDSYLLDYDFGAGGIYSVSLANAISGIGYTDSRSFISLSGSYSFDKNINNTYTKTTSVGYSLPLTGVTCPNPLNSGCTVPTGSNFSFVLGGPFYDSTDYVSDIITSLISPFKIASTAIYIASNGSNDISIPKAIIPKSTIVVDSGNIAGYQLLDANSMDFKVNDVRIFDTLIPIFYSGYNGAVSNTYNSYLLSSGNDLLLHSAIDLNAGDYLSYRIFSQDSSNVDANVNNNIRPDKLFPTMGDQPTKIIRSSNWLLSNNQMNGAVYAKNNQIFTFKMYATGISLTDEGIGNFVSNSHITGEYNLATGTVIVIPDNLSAWTGAGLGYPVASCAIKVIENYQLSDYGNLLTTQNRSTSASLSGRVCETVLYETIDLSITSEPENNIPKNTGIFSTTISVKKPYHTLNFSINSYDELFRFMNNTSASSGIYNNFDVSFNLNNLTSGIFHFDTLSNKLISNYPYSKIYNITQGSTTSFSVAVESGYLPSSITGTGVATFSHSKVYGMKPKSLITTRDNKTLGVFNFPNNNILRSGIYDIESLGNDNTADVQSIYLYDFSKNFSSTGTTATGILYHNHISYNITDSKFSIWGKNFDGDTIIKPFRDLTASIQDTTFSCATGYLCVKLSGVPSFVKEKDVFWIDIEPYIYPQSSDAIVCSGTGLYASNIIYVPDAINSGITLGMNVFHPYLIDNGSENVYITQINGSYLTINKTVTASFLNSTDLIFRRETESQRTITNTLRALLQNYLMGYYPIYKDSIEPGVASILIPIPPFYYNANHPYYNEWNTKQNTRGINVWRSSGNLGSLIMITGTENIQTDKDPNYAYRFLDISPSITLNPPPTGYLTSGVPNAITTGILSNNRQFYYGFNTDLKKYLSDITISGIYKPSYTSGTLSASAQFSNASNWTVSETYNTGVPLIIRDIDSFRFLGVDSIQSGIATPLTISGNNYICNNLPQNTIITFRFGINGGTSIPNQSPDILVSGIYSNYNISKKYIVGLPPSGSGLSSYSCEIGPFSNTWFVDLSISGLNNIDKFAIQCIDPLGKDKLFTEIVNNNQPDAISYINNINSGIYYNTSLLSPWILSFDIENIDPTETIGISGSTLSNTNIISSGITYTSQLQKWQGYVVGHATSSNATYDISFAITGSINPIVFSGGIAFTGSNTVNNKFTNNLSIIKFQNTGTNPIVGYFNYQKPQPYTSPSPILSAANNPSGTTVSFSKISTDYEQITSRELYSFTINNVGITGYDLLISALENNQTNNFTTKILSYNTISISNVTVVNPTLFIGDRWQISFDVNGGGGQDYVPDIQLINAPTKYIYGSSFDTIKESWRVQVTGDIDFIGRNNQNTGIYNIGIYARDLTGYASNRAVQTYLFPVDIQNIKPYYGIKEKDYFINLDLNSPVEYYDSNYTLPSINNFMPSTQTKIYDKYNYLLNIYEIRYSGEKLTDKWNTRLGISNLNQEYNYTSNTKSAISIDVRGLDTDVISVMGLLKLKELDVISTDYPPIQIVSLQPEENQIKELNQGEPWEVSFGVIGGLSNPNYPPSIVLSGLPSVCSGYYPDIDPVGPSCLKTRSYSNALQKWTFAFTGVSNCVTGQYNIAVKAFDLTGEDIADTAFSFTPLINPGPTIEPQLDTAVFPNCQFSSGIIKYKSSYRGLPCVYATGISGVNIIGNLPSGLYLVQLTGLAQPAATGIGVLAITGTPTSFPANNIYDSFIVEVVDKVGKKARSVVTYNTASIVPMSKNPQGATLYFPNSGYYTSYIESNGTLVDLVENHTQKIYDPYPSTGLFNCRSVLSNNNCPPQITGTYQKLVGTGLNLFFGSAQASEKNAYVVLNNNLSGSYNGIYSVINISSNNSIYDPDTGLYIPQYSGLLIDFSNTGAFNGISPESGSFKYVTFDVVEKTLIENIILNSYPKATLSCNTCIMGNGYINELNNRLGGTMKPSMIANITGNYYPYNTYYANNVYMPGGPPNINLISGLQITPINNTGTISEICFSNCYESGSIYLSGVIIPMPTVDITDPQATTYNSQAVALATRCAFGTGEYRGSVVNYRPLSVSYYIRDIINNQYYNIDTNSFVASPAIKTITTSPSPTEVNSISFSAPSMSTGTVLQLYMYRPSDKFPTFDIHSYDYLDHSEYWIHKAGNENDPVSSGSYPKMIPIKFGSGIFITTGNPFVLNGQIIGGNATGLLSPTITGTLCLANTTIEVTGINNQPHNISLSLGSKVGDGLWNIAITGNIIGLTGSYLNDYDYVVNIAENSGIPYGKSGITSLPITMIRPIQLDIPITNNQSESEIYVSYGNKWNFNFNIVGGDRPPRYWSNINSWVSGHYPVIEIDDTICTYDKISLSYNQNTNEWSASIRSKNIVTNNSNIKLSIKDNTGFIQKNMSVVIV